MALSLYLSKEVQLRTDGDIPITRQVVRLEWRFRQNGEKVRIQSFYTTMRNGRVFDFPIDDTDADTNEWMRFVLAFAAKHPRIGRRMLITMAKGITKNNNLNQEEIRKALRVRTE